MMISKARSLIARCTLALVGSFLFVPIARAEQPAVEQQPAARASAASILTETINKWAELIEPSDPASATQTFTAQINLTRAAGLPAAAQGAAIDLAYQAPDHLRISADIDRKHIVAGRDAQQLWVHMPDKAFGIVGSPEVARFKGYPNSKSDTSVPPFTLPISRAQLTLLQAMIHAKSAPAEVVDGAKCHVLNLALLP